VQTGTSKTYPKKPWKPVKNYSKSIHDHLIEWLMFENTGIRSSATGFFNSSRI